MCLYKVLTNVSQIFVVKVLSVRGISDFTHNTPDTEGFFNIIATGGLEYSPGKSTAWDRGWGQKDGVNVQVWNQHG